jgi:FkbM family methyltransferase
LIECGGVWLPDGEQHMVEWMIAKNQRVDGKLTYQWEKQQAALAHCRRFRLAVDIGAHVGLWAMHLVRRFDKVVAFEPVDAHRACFARNVTAPNVRLYPVALGLLEGGVTISSNPTSSGDSRVAGVGDIPMHRLDDYALTEVDFIKADCEGYELLALLGGEATIRRWRPTICVEQKPGMPQRFGLDETGAVGYLERLGAKLRRVISGDYILSFDDDPAAA